MLKLTTSEESFYGDYQITYDDKTMDDGSIIGNIKGDTLIGKYTYLSRNNVRSVTPITFLKTSEKLKLGAGTAGTYMGFHVNIGRNLSFNDSLFQFKPVESEERNFSKKFNRIILCKYLI